MTVVAASERPQEMHWLARGMIVMLAFTLLLAWPVPTTTAAPNGTPPEVDAYVELAVGSEVAADNAGNDPDDPWGVGYAAGILSVELGGFDDDVSPPASWSVTERYAGMEPTQFAAGTVGDSYWSNYDFPGNDGINLALTIPVSMTDYDDDFGGGSFKTEEWIIAAESGSGAATTVTVEAPIVIVQEDGTNARFDAPATGVIVRTRGTWNTSNWSGWLGGHTAWTTGKKSRMIFTTTVTEGQSIALIMPMAENRGEARIKLDGVKVGEVDTYIEGPRRHCVVMWQSGPLAAGKHTIKVINLASDGHARIDVDAFIVAGGTSQQNGDG
jgi:hypothetical protein